MRVVTSDLHEAIAAVSRVYCPHDVKVLESNRGIDAVLESSGAAGRQVVTLRYAAPVKIDAGTFENLLLFMTCVDGAAEATQGRHSVQWGKGRTLPLSPNVSSQLTFDRRFWQSSIRLNKELCRESLLSTHQQAPRCAVTVLPHSLQYRTGSDVAASAPNDPRLRQPGACSRSASLEALRGVSRHPGP